MATADPFATLGLERRFDLEPRVLEARHRELAKALHPDRYVGKSASERRMALNRALEVSEAFRALKDPVRRAEVLATSLGLDVSETSPEKASQALLFEMMEVREELAEIVRSADRPAFDALSRRVTVRRDDVLARLTEAFDGAPSRAEALHAVIPLLYELRYLRRFAEELAAHEETTFETVA